MKRKLVKLGESTIMISLPQKWINRFNLKKGDEVDLEEKDNYIEVSTKPQVEIKEKEIELNGMDAYSVKRYLTSLYRVGYDNIKFRYDNPELIKPIREVIETQLIGFEIIDQSVKSCTIKNLSGTQEDQLENTMSRVIMLVTTISKELLENIKKNDIESIKNIKYMDNGVNRFSNFCRRILTIKGHPKYKKTMFYHQFMSELENLSDEFSFLSDYYANNNPKISKEVIMAYEKIDEIIKKFQTLYLKFDLKGADRLILDIGNTSIIIKALYKNKEADPYVVSYLDNILRRTSNAISSILNINA